MERERKERAEAAKSEFEKLQADRRLLPIYPYREQLLQVRALPSMQRCTPSLALHASGTPVPHCCTAAVA